ncbi:hypothetical protein AAFF_G00279820 [Aldrovandia affinis]|uniref:Uncharacterized protein n=1 Tax=Aldrovandia affinis TaxID=143900 RepID=A0AAD7SRP9_9TELE|nr:hypothetical protein AAFF_G00279820 [Aldrovandia affinis]
MAAALDEPAQCAHMATDPPQGPACLSVASVPAGLGLLLNDTRAPGGADSLRDRSAGGRRGSTRTRLFSLLMRLNYRGSPQPQTCRGHAWPETVLQQIYLP